MANYSFVHLTRKVSAKDLEATLRKIVADRFGDRVEVLVPDRFGPEFGCSHVWLVEIPNTASEEPRFGLAPGENFGFTVQRQRGGEVIVFRHCPDFFVTWFRGVIRERLALHYDSPMFFDATDETRKASRRSKQRYDYPTYGAYMTRNFKKPLSAEDETYFARYRKMAPDGWW